MTKRAYLFEEKDLKRKKPTWWQIHVRWPVNPSRPSSSGGGGDVFFHTKACSLRDAWVIGTEMAEDLVPSICELNYTLWATEAPKYRPTSINRWKVDPVKLIPTILSQKSCK